LPQAINISLCVEIRHEILRSPAAFYFHFRPMSPLVRIARRALIILLITLAILFGSTFVLLRFYEKELVGLVIERINGQLTAKAEAGDVSLTYWKTFPYVSVRFQQVTVNSGPDFPKDTLLRAESVYLGFSLSDLLSKNYTIRNLRLEDAQLNLIRDPANSVNWNIWKSDARDTSSAVVEIRFESVRIRDTRITFEDRRSRLFADCTIENSSSNLEILESETRAGLSVKGILHTLISGEESIVEERSYEITSGLSIGPKGSSYRTESAVISLGQLSLLLSGTYESGEKDRIDCRISGNKNNLSEVLSILPSTLTRALQSYEADGTVNFSAHIRGAPEKRSPPLVSATLSLSDGLIRHRSTGTALEQVSAELEYDFSRGEHLVKIASFRASAQQGQILASGSIRHSGVPVADLNVEAELDLSEIRNFLAIDTLEECMGRLVLRAGIRGNLGRNEHDPAAIWKNLRMEGTGTLTGGSFRLAESGRRFEEVRGTFLLNGSTASVQDLRGTVNGSDFQLNGTASNLIPFLMVDNEVLAVDASLESRLVDLEKLAETSSGRQGESYEFNLPERMHLVLRTHIGAFRFKTFQASEIHGVTTIRNGALSIHPVSFRTADGEMMAGLSLIPEAGGYYRMESTANFRQIDIRKLFASFDNFGQAFLTESHLRGKATADVVINAPLSRNLRLLPEEVYGLIDIRIENGELIRLASLRQLATYIGDNKWLAPFVNEDRFAEKLSHVRFSTLENTIRIEKGIIHIPQMEIRSSAMDISVKGEHRFDKNIDYTIGFRLRDILLRKEREWEEEDDGLGRQMFVYMRGTTDDPQFGIDKQAAREQKKEAFATELNSVKSILREELGLFRNQPPGAVAGSAPVHSPGAVTTIEWAESSQNRADTPPPAPAQQPTRETTAAPADSDPARQKKIPRWLQEKEEYEKEP
jgi:hypothetical protein